MITVMQAGAELFRAVWEDKSRSTEVDERLVEIGVAKWRDGGGLDLTMTGRLLLQNVRRRPEPTAAAPSSTTVVEAPPAAAP
jgi:hypothetical protein